MKPDQYLPTPDGPAGLSDLTRRGALGAAIFTAGYALAIRPVNAAAITTDDAGLRVQEVTYPSFDGFQLPAYVARPAKAGRHRVVIVVNEIFGIHAYIKDTCRRLAKLGYVAIAPAFFARAGDPSSLTDFAEIRKIVFTAGIEQVLKDVDASVTWLDAQAFARTDKIGITGFCWGGRVVWQAVAHHSKIKAGAAWYGRLVAPKNAPAPAEAFPIDVIDKLNGPVIGLYAQNDGGIPQADVDAMNARLKAAPAKSAAAHSHIEVYPGTEHGFHADYRPSYNEAAAKDGWKRMLALFKDAGIK